MSFQASVSKLQSPVKELVLSISKDGVRHVGQSEQDQGEVTGWIEKASQGDVVAESNLKVRGLLRRQTRGNRFLGS